MVDTHYKLYGISIRAYLIGIYELTKILIKTIKKDGIRWS